MDQPKPYPALLDAESSFASSFAGIEQEVRQVREFIGKVLAGYDCRDDAILLASEASTNAVQHTESAGSSFDVCVWLPARAGDHVLFAVRDRGGSTTPTAWPLSMVAETGRGVALFDLLAIDAESLLLRWGYLHADDETLVWFELMARSAATASNDA